MATATKKAKKATKKATGKVHMGLLLDESGSMGPNQQVVIDGTNEYVNALRGEDNADKVRVTLATFDERADLPRCRVLAEAVKLEKFTEITEAQYRPTGMTPLNDAIIETVRTIDEKMKRGDKAMLVIYTDGYENASEADDEAVRKLVKAKEKKGWTFVYLGASIDDSLDAQAEARKRGVSNAYGTVASAAGTSNSLRTANNIGRAYLSNNAAIPQPMAAATHIDEQGELVEKPTGKAKKK